MSKQTLTDSVPLHVFNSLSRERQPFVALDPPRVGMYVCGPTVYSDPHLGHARSAIAFDTVFRWLRLLGYKVRYVRNVTDVGHLQDEVAGEGEDRIARRARLEQVEPMEVVQRYTLSYHSGMERLGCLPPSIEPRASGHIIEQIEVIRKIEERGLAYEVEGNVYFDLARYAEGSESGYGQLSGKILEDLMANTRQTTGSEQKRSPLDFALWKRAEPQHIMRWPSPWGEGFPGWHLECTTMSTRYLGETFDIHGGGLDLQFPHHEAEIAQNHGAFGSDPARYWLHSNMLTVNGQKMAKSLGNFITVEELFSGSHPSLTQGFDPMVVRFFVLQSHYRSAVDFSNEALLAAERGYQRLMAAYQRILAAAPESDAAAGEALERTAIADREVGESVDPLNSAGVELAEALAVVRAANGEHAAALADQMSRCIAAVSDDFHTPRAIASLFELGKLGTRADHDGADATIKGALARFFTIVLRDALGLAAGEAVDAGGSTEALEAALEMLIEVRREARAAKNFARADEIRDRLQAAGVRLEDRADGTTGWVVGEPQ